MGSEKLSLNDQIDEALDRITSEFLRQCAYGAQTKALGASEFAACGQFLGQDAEVIEQHGLHGISAALRVLGPCQSQECRSVVHRIVSYSEASFGVNPDLGERSHLDEREDTENVLKLGELLYGLSFVSTAQAERDRLVKYVSTKLTDSLVGGKGWGYFLGDSEPHLLPTAYAVRGLAANGYDVAAPVKFLLEGLISKSDANATEAADLTTIVACTYCLRFSRITKSQIVGLRGEFVSAWRSLEPLLDEDIEQNLEYWRGKRTFYVRIPWQLYSLALASEFSVWRFGGFRAQNRLRNVIHALRTGAFKYPYSGKYRSSRTHAIAYDVLTEVRSRTHRLGWLHVVYLTDRIRVLAGSRFVRFTASLIAAVIIACSVRAWVRTGKLSDLAPELLASFIALVLAWARR